MDTVSITMGFSGEKNEDLKNKYAWTLGEIRVARKLIDNDWLRSLQNVDNRRIENIWGQIKLLGGDKRVDFLVFLPKMLFVIECLGQ